ncbi:MAG: SIMPL domain-containing protein [Gemmatimonadota bacterium]
MSRTVPDSKRLVVALLALAAPVAMPHRAPAQSQAPPPRTVAVTGEGSVQARPELARLRIGVVTEAPSAAPASRENAQRMQRLVAALREAGVDPEAIQTVQLTIEPVYDYEGTPGQPRLRGFQARNVVEATFEDLDRLGEVVDAAIAAGGNTVEGIRFELREPGEAQARAFADAVADARRKAESLAAAAGVNLGAVQQIDATYGGPIPLPMMARAAVMESRADAPPVSPGELTVTSTVRVFFRIE